MVTKSTAISAGLTVVLLVQGLVLWGIVAFGLGRSSEDLCLDDMSSAGYGSSQKQGEMWPPRIECVLRGPDDPADPPEVTVGHPLLAATWLAGVAGIPVVWLVGTVMVVRWQRKA